MGEPECTLRSGHGADVTDSQPVRRPIRVTLFIDSLGPGGAQRQMSLLAVLFKQRGYDVDVLTYRPLRFFDAEVEAAGVPVRRAASGKLLRPLAVRRAIRERNPDVVIAFLGRSQRLRGVRGVALAPVRPDRLRAQSTY